MKNSYEIGVIVKSLRGDMSLRDFAQKCNISHTTIDNIEKGIDFRTGKPVQIKISTLEKIAVACNVPITYIIGEDQKKQKPTDEGDLSENVVIYHRDGKTVRRTFSKTQLAMISAMLDAIPDENGENTEL